MSSIFYKNNFFKFYWKKPRRECWLKNASIWWRDLWKLGTSMEGGWFGRNIGSLLGNGNDIVFWKEKWCGVSSLRDLFSSLFSKTQHPDGCVSVMGSWVCNSWRWNLTWHSKLSSEEEEIQLSIS
jgi:hypothetical protein